MRRVNIRTINAMLSSQNNLLGAALSNIPNIVNFSTYATLLE
jgi:hypothetical protein